MPVAHRPRRPLVGRAEYRRHADPDRRGQMHGAGVVRHERAAVGQHAGERRQIGTSDQVDDRLDPRRGSLAGAASEGGKSARHFPASRRVGAAANHQAPNAVGGKRPRELGKIRGRPALRAAIGGAGRERDERRSPVPPCVRQHAGSGRARVRRDGRSRLNGTVGKPQRVHELLVVLHLMQSRGAPDRSRQQGAAPLAAIAPHVGNTRARGQERRMDRVRQQERGIEALPTDLDPELVPPRHVDDRHRPLQHDRLVHAGNESKQRRDRRPRRDRDRGGGRRAPHVGDGRQRHDGVAEPVRREDD